MEMKYSLSQSILCTDEFILNTHVNEEIAPERYK